MKPDRLLLCPSNPITRRYSEPQKHSHAIIATNFTIICSFPPFLTTFIIIYRLPKHAAYSSHSPSRVQLNFTGRKTLSHMAEGADDVSGKAMTQIHN